MIRLVIQLQKCDNDSFLPLIRFRRDVRMRRTGILMAIRVTGLLCVLITSVSPGRVYVRSGSEIAGCDMNCPQPDVTLELYTLCGGKDRTLLEYHCVHNFTKSHDPRIQLDPRSGCWKLTPARKEDTCVYEIWCYDIPEYKISSTDICVLDPVLVSSITSNVSRLGQDVAVMAQFSGEEAAVTWEMDGKPLPERYRLIEDNRTLIIPRVQTDDVHRTFRVTITNPVSEEIREYRLIDNPEFYKEPEESKQYRRIQGLSACLVGVPVISVMAAFICLRRFRRRERSKEIGEMKSLQEAENISVYDEKNGSGDPADLESRRCRNISLLIGRQRLSLPSNEGLEPGGRFKPPRLRAWSL